MSDPDEDEVSFPSTWEKQSVTIDGLSRRGLQKLERCLEDDVVPVSRSLTLTLTTEYAHRDSDFLDELQSAVIERMDDAPTPDEARRWERLFDKIPSEYDDSSTTTSAAEETGGLADDSPEEVLHLGDGLDAAASVLRGEADELEVFVDEDVVVGEAADVLQDVIDGLRHRAEESEEILDEHYMRGGERDGRE